MTKEQRKEVKLEQQRGYVFLSGVRLGKLMNLAYPVKEHDTIKDKYEEQPIKMGLGSYSCELMIPKTETKIIQQLKDYLLSLTETNKITKEHFAQKINKQSFYDGGKVLIKNKDTGVLEVKDYLKDYYILSLKHYGKDYDRLIYPDYRDVTGAKVTEPAKVKDAFFAGEYVRVAFNGFSLKRGKTGISFTFKVLQSLDCGEPLGNIDISDMFGDMGEKDESNTEDSFFGNANEPVDNTHGF